MIRYTLVCEADHTFESWFPSSGSFDEQSARGLVTCPLCGSAKVGKGLMTPRIARTDRSLPDRAAPPAAEPAPSADAPVPMIAEPERKLRALLRAVREHVAQTAEHVGTRFPEEARKIHYGEVEERPIYGQATPDEARALIEEGIDVAPLPPMPEERN
ncbi:DUF1178 family protein [Methylobacterium oxalidis]|uniref:DUF1178 domain-containing protein n=1 Tax=Methylobacterium oxalidis TaxID=944322 RepID=A0A512IXZ8_9HYPH|nr:DUF1178 family protein [Methylobacterium oxalidis]GEP02584.1 hypothetical protein MOX02_06220 [Methylobacterium oxalidis]GJE32543.1 hypothetical protein LDDCCGHA_2730 [Methylobacterium oxalidis]GLS61793.1 hypothetical protein GCM10007888_01740 [Methylobacterium oxalidis]